MNEEYLTEQLNLIINDIKDHIDDKKILFCVPESAGDIFLATSLLESLKDSYPDFYIYFACKSEYKDILKNNPYIHKTIQYRQVMDHFHLMEGYSDYSGIFDISYTVTILTQKFQNFHHNGIDKIALNLLK